MYFCWVVVMHVILCIYPLLLKNSKCRGLAKVKGWVQTSEYLKAK